MQPDAKIMKLLIQLAVENNQAGGHAIAAAIVQDGEIIATGVTTIEKDKDPTAQAEVNAIRLAALKLSQRYLDGCYLYTTYEPCNVHFGSHMGKIQRIVFGASISDQTVRCPQRTDIPTKTIAQHGSPLLEIVPNFMRDECVKLL